MKCPVIIRPEAAADVASIFREYEAVRQGLGSQFFGRLRAALERIEAYPKLFAVVWLDVRAVRLKGFRHVLYYVEFAERVEVLAVMHGARDASAWKSRVTD